MEQAQTAATCASLDAAPHTKHFSGNNDRAAPEINVIFRSDKEVSHSSTEESCRGYVHKLMSQVDEAAPGLAETVAGQPRVQLYGREKVTFQAAANTRRRTGTGPRRILATPSTPRPPAWPWPQLARSPSLITFINNQNDSQMNVANIY